ncbi:unnamed protein product [Adineta ricciae]|uniref:Uncharacterized protein n=1 Tax=Adineta ricciae TaxID=249248 RepID=A0A814IAM3_ADIRI|nr:unnamed protein product [Adineta ricciae]CAF1145824.1 unnamed protein product [Adineta ricciae]
MSLTCNAEFVFHQCNPKRVNPNFEFLIQIIQSTYEPLVVSSDESSCVISCHFLQEFNGLNQPEQLRLFSKIRNLHELWMFLILNPTSYDCEIFFQEFYQLTSKFLSVKQHLSFHCEDFLLTLGVSYDDKLRYNCFQIVALLINDPHPQSKETIRKLDRMCYECLYDFHVYYEQIKSFTIESRIIDLTKEDVRQLIDGKVIRSDLEERITNAITELGGLVFFKMHRSPKDAYQSLCKEINNEWIQIWKLSSDEDPQIHFMKIQNCDQLKLLFKNSSRLREDFNDDSLNEKLVLRKWVDALPPEFRCFVCHGQLNAVSSQGSHQHNEHEYQEFFNSSYFHDIMRCIPYSHAVIDCAVNMHNHQVIIIEINPFSRRSSAGKYSWILDRDILYNHYNNHQSTNIRV